MRRFLLILVVAVVSAFAVAAHAGGMDDRVLADLFSRLAVAGSAEDAQAVQDQIWERWMETGDDVTDAALARGTIAMSIGEYRLAMAMFETAITRSPDASEGWNKRATLHYLLGDFDASVRDIDRTLAIEPRHFGALSGLGMIEMARSNHRAALDAYRRALVVNPHLTGVREQIELLRTLLEGRKI